MKYAGCKAAIRIGIGWVPFIAWLGCFSLGCVACAAAGASMATSPPPSSTPTMITPFPAAPTQALRLAEKRYLILEWPASMRVGDRDFVSLTLEVDSQGNITPTASVQGQSIQRESIADPHLFDTHFVLAESRLDISGFEIQPHPQITESLQPGMRVKFAWKIRPEQIGTYHGMVWLHFLLKPKQGGADERLILSAQRIEIRVINLFGLSGTAARWMGVVGILLGSLLSFDAMVAVFGKLWKRLSKPKQPDASG